MAVDHTVGGQPQQDPDPTMQDAPSIIHPQTLALVLVVEGDVGSLSSASGSNPQTEP